MAVPVAFTKEQRPAGSERPIVLEFLVGWGVLWLVLTAGTESDTTADVAAAIAVSIALGATYLYAQGSFANLGLIQQGG